MNLNVWYKVTKEYADIYGYTLRTGWFVKFTDSRRYIGTSNAWYYLGWDGKKLLKDCIVQGPSLPVLEFLEPVPKMQATEIEATIEALKLDNLPLLCDLRPGMLVGSDPEVFVTTADGKLMPAYTFLKAEDKNAVLTGNPYGNGKLPPPYWDGLQAEFKIWPTHCHAYTTDYIRQQFIALHRLAGKDSKIDPTPVVRVPADVLKAAAPEHVALGCMPSFNAYGLQGEVPVDGRELPFRFAGFHVHHAVNDTYKIQATKVGIPNIIKSIDNICGVMSVSVLEDLESPIRRQYYGLAGEYRTPNYGLEYRVLSSAVLWHPALTHLHLDFARAGTQLAVAGLANLWQGSEEETIAIINDLDIDQARKALQRNRRLMLGLLKRYYPDFQDETKHQKILDEIILKGIRHHIALNVEANWHITSGDWRGHSESAGVQMHKFVRELFGKPKVAAGAKA